ncbi:fumarylacetoacetate hydrolase family protein [Pseudonocardia benzenivorans]|jgi:fumarylacetoacetase|uniref:Fumarylacetoacetase n=2 Tax=Pseudonocardia TaxID=1847 RepID=F4CTU7_PSEUX|nr:fumarylacetoacetate hydrolase family protein [Pseudonocardia dioxanivorans]AEA22906.1 Fumarylacetoacetase [Pseudonocardia dioxanivorans CB1190]GJF05008.1 fumarylacetoacetase [Pseudonocardia sp. D17]
MGSSRAALGIGVVAGVGRPGPSRIAAPTPEGLLDVGALATTENTAFADLLTHPTLDALLAAGRGAWSDVLGWLRERLADPARIGPFLLPPHGVTPVLPFTVADYVDFYACEQHAMNGSEILRPGTARTAPNWRHLPVAYHGRAGTVVVSGTPVVRPRGQRAAGDWGPTRQLDVEAELGFVCGGPPRPAGEPVPIDEALDHVFGVVLLNDWSARDIQSFESRPLGPMLGKSFATAISAWVTPLDALAGAWVDPPPRDPEPLPYLRGKADRGLDVTMEVRVGGTLVSSPPAADLYWTPAQLVAHLTSNGASLRPGDLLGSGTVSGGRREQWGSFLELSWGGVDPVALDDGTTRTYLEDGDEVVITATFPGPDGARLALPEVRNRVLPAR